MALLARAIFCAKFGQKCHALAWASGTSGAEISRAVDTRTFRTELNVFRSFRRRAVEMGCIKCRECRECRTCWGCDICFRPGESAIADVP